MLVTLQQVRQFPAVAIVEEELLNSSSDVDLGLHSSIDPVKDSRHPNEQSGLHLSCADRPMIKYVRSQDDSGCHVLRSNYLL